MKEKNIEITIKKRSKVFNASWKVMQALVRINDNFNATHSSKMEVLFNTDNKFSFLIESHKFNAAYNDAISDTSFLFDSSAVFGDVDFGSGKKKMMLMEQINNLISLGLFKYDEKIKNELDNILNSDFTIPCSKFIEHVDQTITNNSSIINSDNLFIVQI
ncbi:6751_t:CDS:1 [Racocetra persica]|uniref:6751_t:CDS:1 n=1 Tax=Racocetra persica TaxID=160502 RepID=A0ACA9NCD9_9GLOM|nr:6751_t:CDS:1 [Racocetra persica]